jgi:hypothetical protein
MAPSITKSPVHLVEALTGVSNGVVPDIALDDVTVGTVTVTEAKNFVLGTTTGSKIGTAVTQKLGFFNATPVVQPASAAQAAVVTTGASTSAYGYTEAQANAIVTLVNRLRADLVTLGLIKGAA